MSLSLQVEMSGVDAVLADFVALPEQIQKAAKRAQAKASTYAAGRLAALVAESSGVPASAIRRRIRSTSGRVWLGYNPIPAAYVGRLEQDPRGAFAGEFFFDRSFVATMPSGHRGVFKRAGKPRLPIEEQGVTLARVPEIAAGLQADIGDRFAELLRQELNFEVNVRGGS